MRVRLRRITTHLALSLSRRSARILLYGSLGLIALMSGGQVVISDPVPWGWVAVFGVGAFILTGPVPWFVRDRTHEERREHLGYVAGGGALLMFPVVLGLGLLFGNLLTVMYAGAFGGICGFTVAVLVERIVVPVRLRSIPQ